MDLIMQKNRKILLVDDEARILDELFKVLMPQEHGNDELSALEDLLFRTSESKQKHVINYDVCRCHQGDEAICEVQKALEKEQPFAVAFIDVQMPPGPDGVSTAEQIRQIDPNIQIVIITGHSDYDVWEISERVPPEDKLLFLQKPIHAQEMTQFALALTAKWQAEHLLRKQNETLIELNQSLKENLDLRKELENQLKHAAENWRTTFDSISENENSIHRPGVDASGFFYLPKLIRLFIKCDEFGDYPSFLMNVI